MLGFLGYSPMVLHPINNVNFCLAVRFRRVLLIRSRTVLSSSEKHTGGERRMTFPPWF